ncbi:uncharacterized protein TNCV_2175231 [Trichonephila clavipes]|nr:uncharacterized protein TNCV_2175231 [Trichonephila clavipes]
MRMQISGTKRQKRPFQTTGTAVRKVGGGRPRTTTAGDDRYIILQEKGEADGCQQASFLSNSLQQRGDKCRGLLWPDAFTKGAYSPAVLKLPPVESLPLTPPFTMMQREQKLDNCQWSRILFTDESQFSARSDSQRVLIWRDRDTVLYH